MSADTGNISDGYHTFDELYQHRHALFLALAKAYGGWAAKEHHDGTMYDGWFIAGMDIGGKQISYHLPMNLWEIAMKTCVIFERAPQWDGHTSEDVVNRLLGYACGEAL